MSGNEEFKIQRFSTTTKLYLAAFFGVIVAIGAYLIYFAD